MRAVMLKLASRKPTAPAAPNPPRRHSVSVRRDRTVTVQAGVEQGARLVDLLPSMVQNSE